MTKKTQTIFFIAGLIIFAFLINDFGFEKILSNISQTGYWFIPIILLWGIVYLINAWSWYIILDGEKQPINFAKVFAITLSGFAINYITPVANMGGEPYRILALKDFIGLNKSVSSTILYTMIHYTSHFLFWLTAVVLLSVYSPLSGAVKIILSILTLILAALISFFISRHKKGVLVSLLKMLKKIPFIKNHLKKFEAKEEIISNIDNEITDFYHERKINFYTSLALDYLSRIIASVEFYFILKAVSIDISILDSIYISATSSLILNIIFFMPMELGIREGSLILIMNGLKLGSGIGIYVGLVNRIREFFWIFIGLILIRLNKNKVPVNKALEEYL